MGIGLVVVLIVLVPVCIFLAAFKKKNPTEIDRVKIIKKHPREIGTLGHMTVEINGEIKEVQATQLVYKNVSEGEVVTMWHNGDLCVRFSKD